MTNWNEMTDEQKKQNLNFAKSYLREVIGESEEVIEAYDKIQA